ncbi:hypothetical protein AADA15_04450 [Phycobacter sp. 'Weihai']
MTSWCAHVAAGARRRPVALAPKAHRTDSLHMTCGIAPMDKPMLLH